MQTILMIEAWALVAGALWWFLLFGKNDSDKYTGALYSTHIFIKLLAYPLFTLAIFFLGRYFVKALLHKRV